MPSAANRKAHCPESGRAACRCRLLLSQLLLPTSPPPSRGDSRERHVETKSPRCSGMQQVRLVSGAAAVLAPTIRPGPDNESSRRNGCNERAAFCCRWSAFVCGRAAGPPWRERGRCPNAILANPVVAFDCVPANRGHFRWPLMNLSVSRIAASPGAKPLRRLLTAHTYASGGPNLGSVRQISPKASC
jgi:hypothetical protein